MLKPGREKIILKQGLIILAVLAGIYIFFLSPFLKEGRSIMDEELERKISEMKRFITLTGTVPSKESFTRMEKDRESLEEKFSSLVNFIDPNKARFSEKNTEAGLYFIEKLHSTMKKFEIDAGSKTVKLPENLGFGDGLPKDAIVPVLLRQLEIVEFTVDALLKSNSSDIYNLKPLKPIEYIEPISKKLFYTELPIQISIKTTTDAFTNLLLELKNASPVINVKELHVKSVEPGSGELEISLVLSSLMVTRKEK
ncbi:MAG: Amuc_1100 family pilus-like protein [Candidatus Omnitrophota bacterium]|nr:Amuc_1100 family pilus-like protein [Candidatus Omnitrophota bacterium]